MGYTSTGADRHRGQDDLEVNRIGGGVQETQRGLSGCGRLGRSRIEPDVRDQPQDGSQVVSAFPSGSDVHEPVLRGTRAGGIGGVTSTAADRRLAAIEADLEAANV